MKHGDLKFFLLSVSLRHLHESAVLQKCALFVKLPLSLLGHLFVFVCDGLLVEFRRHLSFLRELPGRLSFFFLKLLTRDLPHFFFIEVLLCRLPKVGHTTKIQAKSNTLNSLRDETFVACFCYERGFYYDDCFHYHPSFGAARYFPVARRPRMTRRTLNFYQFVTARRMK